MDDFELRIDFQFSSSEKFRFVSSHHCCCSFECFIQFKLSGRWRQGGQNRWKGFWWNVLFYAADAAAGTLEHLTQLKKDLTASQHSWHQLVNEHLVHCPFWSRAFIGGAVFASLIITTTRTFSQVTSLGVTMFPYFFSALKPNLDDALNMISLWNTNRTRDEKTALPINARLQKGHCKKIPTQIDRAGWCNDGRAIWNTYAHALLTAAGSHRPWLTAQPLLVLPVSL